jgi:hypothetical protein
MKRLSVPGSGNIAEAGKTWFRGQACGDQDELIISMKFRLSVAFQERADALPVSIGPKLPGESSDEKDTVNCRGDTDGGYGSRDNLGKSNIQFRGKCVRERAGDSFRAFATGDQELAGIRFYQRKGHAEFLSGPSR